MICVKPKTQKKWAIRRILAPVLMLSHILGITTPKRKFKIFLFIHRLLVFALCVFIFVHEIPSIKYWQDHSEGLHAVIGSKINAIIDSLENSALTLPEQVHNKIFKFNLAHIIINIGLVMLYNIMGHDVTWPNTNYAPYTSSFYILCETFILISALEFIQMVNLISEIFDRINFKLKGFKRKIKSGHSIDSENFLEGNEISRLRELHLYLSKTCAEVNNCFSIQILFLIFFSMIQIIYALRSIVGDFGISDVEESILNTTTDCFWLMPFILILLQLIAFSERTSMQSRKTIIVIHTLMNLYYYDGKTIKELEIFAMQINQHPIIFSVRFFDLDYPFLNTVVSSLATYFIIIVTFQGETDGGGLIDWNFREPTTTETILTTST